MRKGTVGSFRGRRMWVFLFRNMSPLGASCLANGAEYRRCRFVSVCFVRLLRKRRRGKPPPTRMSCPFVMQMISFPIALSPSWTRSTTVFHLIAIEIVRVRAMSTLRVRLRLRVRACLRVRSMPGPSAGAIWYECKSNTSAREYTRVSSYE